MERLTGSTLSLWWTTYQFDAVVVKFGLFIESKLQEMDDKGKYVNTLEGLLGKEAKRSGHRTGDQPGVYTIYADESEMEGGVEEEAF